MVGKVTFFFDFEKLNSLVYRLFLWPNRSLDTRQKWYKENGPSERGTKRQRAPGTRMRYSPYIYGIDDT